MVEKQKRLGLAGKSSAAMMMAEQEAKTLTVANYISSIMLDVHAYEVVIATLHEENGILEKQWETLHQNHIKDLQHLQAAMQGSDAVFWKPATRTRMSANKAWLSSAVEEAMEHRKKTIQKHVWSQR